jgi:hypothetical protein
MVTVFLGDIIGAITLLGECCFVWDWEVRLSFNSIVAEG